MKKKNYPYWPYVTMTILAIMLLSTVAWAMSERSQVNQLRQTTNSHSMSVADELDAHGIVPLGKEQASNNKTTADELAYMIEEEKLAHDVYQVMYDAWGARVFGNIKNSETTHQNLVLAVMQSRSLADPRSSELGVFANQDLQKLYDQMIAQGKQSATEAYKVGAAIEERDIADLKKTIATLDSKDTDVKEVLDMLLRGSENHLRAFSRQASR